MGRYKVIAAKLKDIDLVVEWAAEQGWNPGIYDADCYFAADNNGFLLGTLDGRIISSISAIKYSPDFGFIGFYIVHPQYRGQGYGLEIWKQGMKYLSGCNIALDGVVDQQENYKKSGFTFSHNHIRFKVHGRLGVPREKIDANSELIASVPVALATRLDSELFPASRQKFIQKWMKQPGIKVFGILENRVLNGLGVLRPCRDGYKIGPLYADTGAIAKRLLNSLISEISPDCPVYLDVPEINSAAMQLTKSFNMEKVFETARMYTGTSPNIDTTRIFGVTSFEIG